MASSASSRAGSGCLAVWLVAHPHGLGNGSAGADQRAMALPDPVGPLAFVARAVAVVQYALAVLDIVAPSPLVLQAVVALRVAVDAKTPGAGPWPCGP